MIFIIISTVFNKMIFSHISCSYMCFSAERMAGGGTMTLYLAVRCFCFFFFIFALKPDLCAQSMRLIFHKMYFFEFLILRSANSHWI